ncbi:MAG TPA: flagellar basal body rod protein FlgC [Candidatus Saccharimonadales bacterium]|nr:flagellar basal body rod protein FlgC [Candidatus Saccharimonadales bacterium]
MNLFGVMGISASGLSAERMRAEVVASNMANAESTHTTEGGPYQRKEVVFQSTAPSSFRMRLATASESGVPSNGSGGVSVRSIVSDTAAPIMRYEPSHPDADSDGFVAYPNINPVLEMTDLMGAARAYQMNASAVQAAKQMIQQSIELLK